MSGHRWPWQASPARLAAWRRYEEKGGAERKRRKAQQQRDRRRREREAGAANRARLAAMPPEQRDIVTGEAQRRAERQKVAQEAAKLVVRNYMVRAGINRTFTCEEQRNHQRLGKLRCLHCGVGKVVGRRDKDAGEPVFSCNLCNERPVCACCWRAS